MPVRFRLVWLLLLLACAASLCGLRLLDQAGPAWPGALEVFPAVDGSFRGRTPAVSADADGAGGAILVFTDGGQVRAQRVSRDGELLWGAEGVPIPSLATPSWAVRAVADGSGGILVAWLACEPDATTGCDAYVQRLDGDGALLWDEAGVFVSDAATPALDVASDGAGGAWVAWGERAACVQRIDASGVAAFESGALPCTAGGSAVMSAVRLLPDGAGGVFLAWAFSSQDWAAHRVSAGGAFLWPEAIGDLLELVPDGAGGLFGVRQGFPGVAQRVNADGETLWSQRVSDRIGLGRYWRGIADGAGGVIFVWSESEGPDDCFVSCDVRAQRLGPAGERIWGPDGSVVATSLDPKLFPTLVSDGAAGAIPVWRDCRELGSLGCVVNVQLFAQRIDASGARRWFGTGVKVNPERLVEEFLLAPPRVISDEAGGALVAWRDGCTWSPLDGDRCVLFAQRIAASGEALFAACEDGFDDDGDGLLDHPEDPGCDASSDDDEHGAALPCDDGLDQEGDGLVDFPADPGCSSATDESETGPGRICDDGLDNDGDGTVDLADAGCDGIFDDSERLETTCDNAFDDDGDGRVDFPDDPGCTAPADVSERSECAPDDFLCDRRLGILAAVHELKWKGRGRAAEVLPVEFVFGAGIWVAGIETAPGPPLLALAGDYRIVSAKKGKAELRVSAPGAQELIDLLLPSVGAARGSLTPPADAVLRLRARDGRPVRLDARWKLEPSAGGRRGSYRLKPWPRGGG